ncbi:MAG: 16S rRNA (guanine(527)-N(7))-methyltransferase RsmG [Alphaproteobacteria bacterium]|nr:16S rRNA (guanine(527)-N(7))-methyltransferase RsmG [Alphaproteobacteria bacterium]
MKNTMEKYNVSRETIELLKAYEASLNEWQQRMNLVSKNSLSDAWNRHFRDSMQLFDLLPQNAEIVYDFGSGAGFPGMVLAIVAKEKTPYLKFKLVESIKKKTMYLKHVGEITCANVEIINERIENIKPETADAITSRAMCSLPDLLKYSKPFCNKNTKLIFLKGRSYLEEVKAAQREWIFQLEVLPNQESEDGVILIITKLRHKGEKNA